MAAPVYHTVLTRLKLGSVAVGVVAFDACGPEGSGPPPPTPATIAASAGNDQIGPAGQALSESLAVVVRDASGNPLSGVNVTWAVGTGNGAVSPATAITGAGGIARASRTLGPNAGTQTATATVSDLPAVTFSAVAQIQGAVLMGSRVFGQPSDTVLGTITEFEQAPKVLVVDHNGQPVQHVVVMWKATGGGSVSATSVPTDAGGESVIDYTFGSVAGSAYGAEASVPGLIGSPVVFQLFAQPGNAVAIEKSGGDGAVVQVGGQVVHTVTMRDAYGNPAQGVLIQWAAATGGGSITPAENVTGNGGRAEATRTLGPGTGEQTATATAPSVAGSPFVAFTTIAATTAVRVANNVFLPSAVSVQQGDSVAWQWLTGAVPHNIIFATMVGSPADVPDRTSGAVWRTFATPGTFGYQCTNHGGMTGTVMVVP